MSNVNPIQDTLYIAMSAFLQASLGLSQSVVLQGLPNRSAIPPASPGFVTMQIENTRRLRQNVDTWVNTDDPTTLQVEQGTQVRMQLDFYGSSAGDWAVTMSALLRDEVGCVALAPNCQPLYTDDAQLVPLEDDEEQYEQRWSLNAYLQYNPVVTTPMTFANDLKIELINVDVTYPPLP